jgi:hypothetical protein
MVARMMRSTRKRGAVVDTDVDFLASTLSHYALSFIGDIKKSSLFTAVKIHETAIYHRLNGLAVELLLEPQYYVQFTEFSQPH